MGRMVSRTASLAAGASVDNAFTGKAEEIITRPSHVRIMAAAGALGVTLTLLVGNPPQNQVDEQEISGANRFPVLPDDFVNEFTVTGPADRLVAKLRNPTGGAITNVIVVADITPLR